MKQFYLLALFCAVSLMCVFTACDDDDEAATWPDGSEISALYENKSTSLPESNKLMLTYSGGELIGKGVYLKAEENTLVLYNVFPAEKETFIYNVPLTAAADGYTFAGSSTTAAGTPFDYAGKVMPGVMVLNLTNVKVAACKNFVGSWGLKPVDMDAYTSAFHLVWETDSVIPALELITAISPMVGFFLPPVLNKITFGTDGNITARYSGLTSEEVQKVLNVEPIVRDENDWSDSPFNLCMYYEKDNKLYVILNVDMILKTVQANATKATASGIDREKLDMLTDALKKLSQWGTQGIPLNVKQIEGGYTLVYLDEKELGTLFPLLQALLPMLKETLAPSLGELAPIVDLLLDAVDTGLSHTTKFEIGLALQKNN